MSSKIEKELVDATDLSSKRGEERQDFLARLMKAVQGLNDKEWDALTKPAQDWFNDCADAVNENKDKPDPKFALPDFPDMPKAEEPSSRRRGAAKEEEERMTKVGDTATVLTKRGKSITGEVVELDSKIIVLKTAEGEEEFSMDRVESVTVNHGTAGQQNDEPAGEPELEVGTEVTLVTKRGKEVKGAIVELTDDIIVLDVDGKEEEYARDRVETIKAAGAKASSGRRGAAATDKKDEPAATTKRSSNAPGVSIGTRIKELIAENLDLDVAGISKLLKKEGIEFKENTLTLNYSECHKFVDILVTKKMLKK